MPVADRAHLTIGEVLTLLREEFPDVSISKIRFLESQGLVNPERTPSGYRKFYDHDVARLRWILQQQREHFLPLKVIRGRLDPATADAGAAEATGGGRAARPGRGTGGGGSPRPGGGAAEAVLPSAAHGTSPQGAAPAPGRDPASREPPAASRSTPAPPAAVPAPQAPEPAPPAPRGVPATAATSAPVPPTPDPAAAPVAPPAPAAPPARTPEAHDGRPAQAPGPAALATGPARVPRPAPEDPRPPASRRPDLPGTAAAQPEVYTAEELAASASCEVALVQDLAQYGLLVANATVGGVAYYHADALAVTRAGARFAAVGVEPRHLRAWRNAADREASLFEQLVMPLLRQRNPQARKQATDLLAELAELGGTLRAALMREAVRSIR